MSFSFEQNPDACIVDLQQKKPLTVSLMRADIDPTVRFHDPRHTVASWLLSNGLNLEQIRLFLGHGDIQTTQRYLHVEEKDVAEVDVILQFFEGKFLFNTKYHGSTTTILLISKTKSSAIYPTIISESKKTRNVAKIPKLNCE